jgi:hypothetical protein
MTASDCRQRSRKRRKKRVQTICFENKRGKGRGDTKDAALRVKLDTKIEF